MQPSRQLMYFLLGLILPFLAFRIAYSGTCPSQEITSADRSTLDSYVGNRTMIFYGTYTTESEARAALPSGANLAVTVESGRVFVFRSVYNFNYTLKVSECIDPDTDGDGLPDECDFYPDDSTPYSIKLLSYQTTDNTWEGDHTRECYQTDRGDTYCIGSSYDNNKIVRYRENQPWTDPSGICSSTISTPKSDPGEDEGKPTNPPVSNEPTDGDPGTDTDPTLQPGEKSDGTETGDAALRDIKDNTGDIASNTKRLGEYARDLNSAIQNMDRNLTLANERAENDALEKKQAENEAETEKANLENYDVEGALAEHINPDITEGPDGDYQEHGPLAEESWVTEFIDSNPISTVLGNSGFQYSNSRCTADLNLGYLGQHSIDICELEDGFTAFGQLLVALVTLTGLVHVVTGRGF